MEDTLSLKERNGDDTSVGNIEGVNGGPRIQSRLEGEKARVFTLSAWRSKKLPACLKPSLVGGLILFFWCLLVAYVVLYYTQQMVCLYMHGLAKGSYLVF